MLRPLILFTALLVFPSLASTAPNSSNQAQERLLTEFLVQETESTRQLHSKLTIGGEALQGSTSFVDGYFGAVVLDGRDSVIDTAHPICLDDDPTAVLVLSSALSMILKSSCPDTTRVLMNSNSTLTTEDLEPWITFLFERLADHWPWIHDITPQQIQTLSRLLATLLERVIPTQSLHTESEVDIQTIVEEIILETMNPESVQ